MKKFFFLLTFLCLSLSLITAQTVVDVVVNSPDHNTLETAVIAADLGGTLSGEGPFTLFAPTDAAFNLIDPATLNSLLADPSGALTDILLSHVVSGVANSSNIFDGLTIGSLSTQNLAFAAQGNGLTINGINISVANIPASNGVVHVIDAVILPPARTTVVDVVVNSPDHNTLETAVIAAGLAGTLSGEGPFTLFAPTDAAFNLIDAVTLNSLLADPSGALTDILLSHVVSGVADSNNISNGLTIGSLSNLNLTFAAQGNGLTVNGINISVTDIRTSNGVVHVIDAVILP